jgi:hypothetical protein
MKADKITVRWLDAETGEDFTDRMNDGTTPPGEGVLAVARALAKLMAAEQFQAERELLRVAWFGLQTPSEMPDGEPPQAGDIVTLDGVSYRYDCATETGEHFTRLAGRGRREALLSLSRGSAEVGWVFRQFV